MDCEKIRSPLGIYRHANPDVIEFRRFHLTVPRQCPYRKDALDVMRLNQRSTKRSRDRPTS